MSPHPLTLAVRCGLVIAALVAYGVWGWHAGERALRLGLAAGLPQRAARRWGAVVAPRKMVAPGHRNFQRSLGIGLVRQCSARFLMNTH
ncbi:DUF2568 domain-containing protein [Candidatus Chloroploca sp. Khr17]|uniref:DUF2568 domain-containing protein n=1 Tax=Candidatus Chloroploca sp. Khr17 TaxID=2496869 RepID=UPI00101D5833|nr:DUF2568 domain-containing protein [Candidatus Chloroploca sp. Khr17]